MNDSSQSQWWDFDPSEVPIPLGLDEQAVVEAAEQEVASAHEALTREETQPIPLSVTPRLWRDSLRLAVAVLLLGCLVMFSAGFRTGSASVRTTSDERPADQSRATSVTEAILFGSSEPSSSAVAIDRGAPSQQEEEM